MSDLSFPSDLSVAGCNWRLDAQDVEFRSKFAAQSVAGSLPMWLANLTGTTSSRAGARRVAAFLDAFMGYRNRVELWNFANPAPAGTLRGALTLAADATAGATSLQIAADWLGANLAVNGDFSAGTLSGWTLGGSSALTTGSVSAGVATITRDPSATTSGRLHQAVATMAGRAYQVRADLILGTQGSVNIYVRDGNSNVISGGISASGAGSKVLNWVALSSQSSIVCYTGSVSGDNAKFDNITIKENFAGLATLLFGDLLGIGSGSTQQVLSLAADATADAGGAITVNLQAPLRNDFAAGTVLVWDRPKAWFRQKEKNSGIDVTPDGGAPWSLSLIEDWRP